jgi:uncharacterized protein (DUF427 family)
VRSRPKALPVDDGQESVWEYPRPPRVEQSARRVRVVLAGVVIADTNSALRVLETSHPPTFYIPLKDIRPNVLVPTRRTSFCEYKGEAGYFTVITEDRQEVDAAWYYPDPAPGYDALLGHVAFYPGRMDACYVGDELVRPQPGGFYGGWITSDVVGPFKGERGTEGW